MAETNEVFKISFLGQYLPIASLAGSEQIKNKKYASFSTVQNSDNLQGLDIFEKRTQIAEPYGNFGKFKQRGIGSCWFLTSLRNASYNPEYVKSLKSLITNNNDGTYTIKFKGVKEWLKQRAEVQFSPGYMSIKRIESIIKEKYPNITQEEKNNLINFWSKTIKGKSVQPSSEKEKFLLEESKKFLKSTTPEKLEKLKKQFINDKTKEMEKGVVVTEEELKSGDRTLPNGTVQKDAFSEGDKGVKILERAMDKFLIKATDGQRTLDIGDEDEGALLLLGKKSEKYEFSQKYPTTEELEKALSDYENGKISEEEFVKMQFPKMAPTQEEKELWRKILDTADSSRLVAGSAKLLNPKNGRQDEYIELNSKELGDRKIITGHAYNISKIDKKNQIVYVENPWEPDVQIPLTYDEFLSSFITMRVIKD